MRSPFQMRVPALQQPERADRNNFYLYLYKAINQSSFLGPTIILTCRKTSTDKVLVIAVINLGRNVLRAPIDQLPAKFSLPSLLPQIACPPNRRLEQLPSNYSHFQRSR